MGRTKVIAIEGIDGSGKSVQYERLCRELTSRGFTVEQREYPVYSAFFGGQVGKYLSSAEGIPADTVDGRSMALWFALDRWEDLKGYEDGAKDYLVINRYVLSNAVYQSIRDIDIARPDIVDWVFELEYGRLGLPRADVYLFYDVATGAAGENVLKKGVREYTRGSKKDVYEASQGIQQRARAKYLEAAGRREDIAVIQCMGENGLRTVEEIAAETIKALELRGLA